jgi:hypothetical protein
MMADLMIEGSGRRFFSWELYEDDVGLRKSNASRGIHTGKSYKDFRKLPRWISQRLKLSSDDAVAQFLLDVGDCRSYPMKEQSAMAEAVKRRGRLAAPIGLPHDEH